ncbi:hypothetical protein K435DRAFT_861593 [Dendrothele bispora CBS 962.96]|uniref:Uncharacterized protein n=1 Tax=Dendrothele bispora (strain CBS 962.96) TaxID=1314807 RepID=A0A4S8LUX0_DENBC|nr:hypothetical protein K435DRAFT_861593 [Dendrothele bispora CBS 962.96]
MPPSLDGSTEGWKECFHPNGWKYRYHPSLHVISTQLTEAEISNDPKLGQEYRDAVLGSDSKPELYVNHKNRSASRKWNDVRDDVKLTDDLHIAYWDFMCRFPAHRALPKAPGDESSNSPEFDSDAFRAAKQVLNFFKMDLIRRQSDSNAPFTLEQCKELLEYLNTYEEPSETSFDSIPSQTVAFTALISWILWTAAKHRKLHGYGTDYMQSEARHLHEALGYTQVLFHLVSSTLLFGAARSHFERISTALETMRLQDRTDAWVTLLSTLDQELTVSNLGSTVLLSSSTAFLAVPGMDKFSRIVTLVSVVLTLGSVMTGLYLQWQTGKIRFKDESFEPMTLAIAFSIPFAALVWAIILFTASVITYSVLGTRPDQDSLSTTFGNSTWIAVLAVSSDVFEM